jgi:transposase-like protein
MAEMALERGLLIHSSCIWRWVQIYGPELDKRCRAHLKRTDTSYRVDETYIRIKGQDARRARLLANLAVPHR